MSIYQVQHQQCGNAVVEKSVDVTVQEKAESTSLPPWAFQTDPTGSSTSPSPCDRVGGRA